MIIQSNVKTKISNANDIYKILKPIYNMADETEAHKEKFYSIGLDTQNNILYIDLVTMGTINQCSPHIREVLRTALLKNANSIIISHNHPSGTLTTSKQDNVFTAKLKNACNVMEVNLLDHIIYTENGYYSYSDQNKF